MKEYFIKEYLNKLQVDDILNYAKKNNYNISYDDADILLFYAKKYYHELLTSYPEEILKEIKRNVSTETYKIAYKLYIENKIKYLK